MNLLPGSNSSAACRRWKNPRVAVGIFSLVLAVIAATASCDKSEPVDVTNRPPTVPSSPSPVDSALGQALDVPLEWDCSDPEGGALLFDLYFGTAETPPSFRSNLAEARYDSLSLGYSTTYFWKVVAKDEASQTTAGKVWRFTTVANGAPSVPSNPSPLHLSTNQPVSSGLTWSCSDPEGDVLLYDIFLAANAVPVLVATDVAQTYYQPAALQYAATYYWRVRAKDGVNQTDGPQWQFTTVANYAPAKPHSPTPADGTSDLPLQVTLQWQSSDPEGDPLVYDVYFGTESNPSLVATNHTQNSYVLQQLEYGPTYYWKIVAKDDHQNQVTGDIWSFRTLAGVWTSVTSPTTNILWGIWGSSPADIHVVGQSGTILHYNGSAWSAMTSPTTQWLYDVWGTSGSDVFAVGSGGTILHFNGSAWTAMTSGSTKELEGVWGSSGSNVFAVGFDGTILRYNGAVWSALTSGTAQHLRGTGGTSGTNVYAVGDNGTVLRFDGASWGSVDAGVSERLYHVWGPSASGLWMVGYGTLVHFNGTSWSPVTIPSYEDLRGVWGSAANDVFVAGISGRIRHYDGSVWRIMDSGTTEHLYGGVWGTSRSNVYAVGDKGKILRFSPP